jgi:DTW domain-containing protein YfiP
MQRVTNLSNKAIKDQEQPFRQNCFKCFRPLSACFCSDIETIRTHTRFLVLMHPKEARKVKQGTGRITHLFLKNSELITGVDFTEDDRVNNIIADPAHYPVILYPGENSIEIGAFRFPDGVPDKMKLLVFVIDASWTLAKKMLKLSTNLHVLPKIHFSPQEPSRYVIKKQPHESCLSTIESVHALLQELNNRGIEESQGKHQSLLAHLDRMCHHQIKYTEDASPSGYRKNVVKPSGKKRWPDERRYPGKRQRRSVCFD